MFKCPWPECTKVFLAMGSVQLCVYAHAYKVNTNGEQNAGQDGQGDHQMVDHGNAAPDSDEVASESSGSGPDDVSDGADDDEDDELDLPTPTNAGLLGGIEFLDKSINALDRSIDALNLRVRDSLRSIHYRMGEARDLIYGIDEELDSQRQKKS